MKQGRTFSLTFANNPQCAIEFQAKRLKEAPIRSEIATLVEMNIALFRVNSKTARWAFSVLKHII